MADFGNRRSIVGTGGGGFNALDFSKAEGKHEFFKLKVETNRFDILPYEITTKKHPLVAKGKMKQGELDYNLDIFVHRRIGAAQKSYVCPNRNYNRPCPICEAAQEAKDKGDDKTNSALYASRRIFYNVVDVADLDKGVQIFETNFKYFQKPLEAADKDSQEEYPDKFFADPKNGLTVKCIGSEEKFDGNKFVQPTNISLVPRKASVKEFVADAIQFDTLIEELSYDELANILAGAEDDEEEDVPAPKRKVAKADDDDDAPAPKRKAPKEDDEDDDVPPPKKVAKPPVDDDDDEGPKCPHGYKWGKDNGEKPECEDCSNKLFRACAKAGE